MDDKRERELILDATTAAQSPALAAKSSAASSNQSNPSNPSKPSSTRASTGNQGSNILSAFQTHHLSLKRFIGRYLNSAQDIEDVTQEAFMRAFSAEKTTEVHQPKSFLFRIAKNVAITQLRKKSNQITDYIEDQPSQDVLVNEWSTEDEVLVNEKLDIHSQAVAALPPKCREVYLLRKVYGLSHKEIAAKLGIASSTVEKHLMKGVEDCDKFIEARMAQVNKEAEQPAKNDWYYQAKAHKPKALSQKTNSQKTNSPKTKTTGGNP